ncbi:DsrE family protein [Chitinophaga varians]|uniref:DsrE family protein n=1 Tax=Chitinophaga varians TaxID=2202339 RepID=UPI00165FB6C8|nr:DsrE family protein [Chitinophaga varians]MBC9914713.1 DsrE family protein [Chitinophaga varians]
MQVIFQITSAAPDAQRALLGQLNNLLQYYHDRQSRITVEVAVHGDAYPLLFTVDNPFAARVEDLHARSVSWLICQNTINGKQLKMDQLLSFVEVVPAAVAHLVERQMEGWAYIRC